jgi:hypothetical protein
MILTFYKTKAVQKSAKKTKPASEGDPAVILSEVFDTCLANGTSSFTSEALFNRLIVELWHRRALGCLSLDRREFSNRLEQRGWSYNARTHLWTKGYPQQNTPGELALFGP